MAESEVTGGIDYWCNAFSADRAPLWDEAIRAQGIQVKVRSSEEDGFCDASAMVRRMDDLGIDTIVIPTCRPHHGTDPLDFSTIAAASPEEMERLATEHPGRFVGTWSVDPLAGIDDVHATRKALEHPWIVGLHLHTHSFDRALDHADLFPYYTVAAEEGVPVVMQAGTSGGLMPSECGRPIGIDRPAIFFKDTPFVLSHLGWPWVDEAIAMALKFPNVHLGTAVYPARHWPPSVTAFLRGPGKRKVLYGTGFPTTGHRHTIDQVRDLELSPEVAAGYLGGNARRIFTRLPSTGRAKESEISHG